MPKRHKFGLIAVVLSGVIALFNNCGEFKSSHNETLNDSLGLCVPTAQEATKLFRVSNDEYRQVVSDLIGAPVDRQLFIHWTPIAQVYGFDTMSEARIDSQTLQTQMETVAQLTDLAIASPQVAGLCGSAKNWEACGKPVLNYFASRAFRRPLRADEVVAFKELYDSSAQQAATALLSDPATEGLKTVLQAVLLSPNLMFKPEFVPGGFDPSETNFIAASKLSFYFRSSFADDSLWNLAANGQLNSANIQLEASRMMDQYSERFVKNFGGQWLDFRDTLAVGGTSLTDSMAIESYSVFKRILTGDMTPEKLLNPGFTIVNQALATHYNLPFTPGANPFQEVPTSDRGGVLTQGLFLANTSTGSEMSRPIHRGIWTLTRLLCRTLPRLDRATLEEINNASLTIDPNLPLSAQSALHRNTASRCFACHSQIDPVGLALENFDKQGLWRTQYPNGADITNDFAFNGTPVKNPGELANVIEHSAEYKNCVATKILTFALNRPPSADESCLPQSLSTANSGSSLKQMSTLAILKSMGIKEGQ